MRIYLASSWRNEIYPGVLQALRKEGHQVFDFREPVLGSAGFSWQDIDPEWKRWGPALTRVYLDDPRAQRAYLRDMKALEAADAVVLISPCGKSAHLEMGWAIGREKPAFVLMDKSEPELMYRLALETSAVPAYPHLCTNLEELTQALRYWERNKMPPLPLASVDPDPNPPAVPTRSLPSSAEDMLAQISDPEMRERVRNTALMLTRS